MVAHVSAKTTVALLDSRGCQREEMSMLDGQGGHRNADEGMVTLSLCNISNKSINVEIGFKVKDCVDIKRWKPSYDPVGEAATPGGWQILLALGNLDSLVDGTLVIEVHLKLFDPPPFIPENPSACKIIQGMFINEESADIVFGVRGQQFKYNSGRKPRYRR
ncbi:hypothetical protein ACHAW5_009486 [Stephanodiscus triporus]|uniref:Uncharacterized protein n=1 Tax=Stephanodiscus triporus TaxID=2934178 RepID=A0ABD3NI46_9STRA